MRLNRLILLSISVLFLSACASHLTQQQCQTMNWTQEGINDGSMGRQPRNLQSAIQDCQKFKLTVDTAGYQKGWKIGAKRYCSPTYQMGVMDGQAGKNMDAVISRQSFCQQAGLTLSTASYKKGYQSGLSKFCTYDDGYNIGYQGKQPPEVCAKNKTLQAKFMAGWNAGARKFCSRPGVAFTMGKQGQPYPQACNPAYYANFQSEYNRGQVIYQRVQQVQSQINTVQGQIDSVNNEISGLVSRYDLRQNTYDSGYHLGSNHSHEARSAMYRVRDLLAQRQSLSAQLQTLQNSLFQAQATK